MFVFDECTQWVLPILHNLWLRVDFEEVPNICGVNQWENLSFFALNCQGTPVLVLEAIYRNSIFDDVLKWISGAQETSGGDESISIEFGPHVFCVSEKQINCKLIGPANPLDSRVYV